MLHKRIDFKMALFFLIVCLITLGSFLITYTYIELKREDEKAINLAGKQRMLIQKMSNEAFNIVFLNNDSRRTELKESSQHFQESLNYLLMENIRNNISSSQNDAMYQQLLIVKEMWENFNNQTEIILENGKGVEDAIHLIEDMKDPFVTEMDKVVFMMEQESSRHSKSLQTIITITIVLIILLSLTGWWLLYFYVTKPIKKVTELANKTEENGQANLSALVFDNQEHLPEDVTNLLSSIKTYITSMSSQQLFQYINQANDSIILFNPQLKIVLANPASEHVYGFRPEELIGKKLSDIPTDISGKRDEIYNRALQGQCTIGYETIRKRKDGKIINVSITLSPLYNYEGKIISLVCTSRDISNRKQTEHQLRKTQRDLQVTVREQQGIIFKFSKIGNQFIHTLCDGALLKEVGYTPDQVIGKSVYELTKGYSQKLLLERYQESWSGKDVEFEFVPCSGKTFLIHLKPIFQQGNVVEVIGSIADISKLKEAEDLLKKSEKLAIVGEMAAGIAHEIRNPLTTLKGFVQLIGEEIDAASSNQQAYFELMKQEIDRIETITQEFMLVAKPQAVIFKKNQLINIINNVVTFFKPQALLHNIRLDVQADQNISPTYSEENQLKQVFINLIKNAMEAMPTGGDINIQLTQQDNQIIIRISDTGDGIPEEILPKLGEPFYTLKEKGTGLGLMVTKRIIHNHNGNIEFKSTFGKGTTVEITLPIIQKPEAN